MKLVYESKKDLNEWYNNLKVINEVTQSNIEKSTFFNQENSVILRSLCDNDNVAGKIDLIYIDPPYGTGRDFRKSEKRATSVSNEKKSNLAYNDFVKGEAFYEFIRERIFLLHKLLSDKGSIYIHIDCKISHYIKIICDEIFGENNFVNEITRIKCNPKNFSRKAYGNYKDTILFYKKNKEIIWNDITFIPSKDNLLKKYKKIDIDGRRYTTVPLHAPGETLNGETNKPFKGILPPAGRHWKTDIDTLNQMDSEGLIEWSKNKNPRKKIFLDLNKGEKKQDVWIYKDGQNTSYPTEKNYLMMDYIIKNSSNNNSIVLDCFAGSGNFLLAASNNNRKFIGVDLSIESYKTIQNKFVNKDIIFFLKNGKQNNKN